MAQRGNSTAIAATAATLMRVSVCGKSREHTAHLDTAHLALIMDGLETRKRFVQIALQLVLSFLRACKLTSRLCKLGAQRIFSCTCCLQELGREFFVEGVKLLDLLTLQFVIACLVASQARV